MMKVFAVLVIEALPPLLWGTLVAWIWSGFPTVGLILSLISAPFLGVYAFYGFLFAIERGFPEDRPGFTWYGFHRGA